MTKYITVIIAAALLCCFSGQAYCFSMNDLKNAATQAASAAQQAAANKASKGTSNAATTNNANTNTPQIAAPGVTDNSSFEFQASEFTGSMTPEALIKAIGTSGIGIPPHRDPIRSLNDLLSLPNLYTRMKIRTDEINSLIGRFECGLMRGDLELQKLNRLLIEANYPLETPKRPNIPTGTSNNNIQQETQQQSNQQVGVLEAARQQAARLQEAYRAEQQRIAQQQAEQQRIAQQQADQQQAQRITPKAEHKPSVLETAMNGIFVILFWIFWTVVIAVVILCIVAAPFGISKGLKRELVIFETKKDLAIPTICLGSFFPLLVLGIFTLFITFFLAFIVLIVALIYNIVKSVYFGRTAWERCMIFAARSLLSVISTFIVIALLSPPQRKDGADGVDRLVHQAFWAGVATVYYRWLMRFIKEEQIGDVKVMN